MRVPLTTYRLQLNRDFRFDDARSIVRYLEELGVTDLYASPILKARPGSTHGYDLTDPTAINPEIGIPADFHSLVDELEFRKMGLLLDIVPNHMAASMHNPYWRDVLEHGRASRYANFFDIDWSRSGDFLAEKVMLPILGAPYETVLDNQELHIGFGAHGFVVSYYEHDIPLDPRSYPQILCPEGRQAALDSHDSDRRAWETVLASIDRLGSRTQTHKDKAIEVEQRCRTIKEEIWRLYTRSSGIKAYLDENIGRFNGARGKVHGAALLDQLLSLQAYRLCYWRKALEEINYRRFFDINDLIAVRVEDVEVAQTTHELILRWISESKVTGLRIDHIDGLYDPAAYLEWLRDRAGSVSSTQDFYVVVEKILTGEEKLRQSWQTAGTTGYEFIAVVNGIFLDRSGMARLRKHYQAITESDSAFLDVRYEMKKQALEQLFASEAHALEHELLRLAANDKDGHTLQQEELSCALREVSACLPVYRTYADGSGMSEEDRRYIAQAVEEAERRNPAIAPQAMDFLRKVLLLETEGTLSKKNPHEISQFVRRWQQLTGPLMAKGLEDTTHYVYNCLISQNEVGSDPAHALGREQFHDWGRHRRETHPHSLNTTATHDTKRGEDVRARIHVLSELAGAWEEYVEVWRQENRDKRQTVAGKAVPDANTELFLYQTLIGAWPFSPDELPHFKDRIKAYMVKAAREAKAHTSWLDTQEPYENALISFVDCILDDRRSQSFLKSFGELQEKVAFYGALNSLSQLLLKISAPGVPDFYQGTELWDLSLVDPDNRRPVDFVARTQALSDAKNRDRNALGLIEDLRTHWRDGRIKLYTTYRCLNFRKTHPRVFLEGDYVPLKASGNKQRHLFVFGRRAEPVWVVSAVPRLVTDVVRAEQFPLGEAVWNGTRVSLPARAPDVWVNLLTGETLRCQEDENGKMLAAGEIFGHLPVALLAGNVNLDDFAAGSQ